IAKTGAPGSSRIRQQPSIPLRLRQCLEFGARVVGVLDPQDIPTSFQQELLGVVEERHVEGVTVSGQEKRQMVDSALRTQKPVRHGLIAIAMDGQRRRCCHVGPQVARRQDGKTARRQDGKDERSREVWLSSGLQPVRIAAFYRTDRGAWSRTSTNSRGDMIAIDSYSPTSRNLRSPV